MAQKQPQKIDDTGWIKLHRKIQLNPLWTERRRFSRAEAWIDILMEARHDPEPAKLLIGNKIIECKRGECIKSLDTWASRWKWNKSAVRRFFDLLQGMNQIRHENETKTTRLFVCNYDTYNGTRNKNETEMKRKRNADETHLTPNKNDKNEENGKNEENPTAGAVLELPLDEPENQKPKSFKQWTRDDLTASVQAANADGLLLPDEAENFIEYWTEPTASGKFRFTKQDTWDTRLRMKTAFRMIYEGKRKVVLPIDEHPVRWLGGEKMWDVPGVVYDDFVRRYPGVDVDGELVKLNDWLHKKPDVQKTKSFRVLIENWLERAKTGGR
jgi:hypothetical protein